MARNYKSKKTLMDQEETKKRSFFFGTSPDIPKVVELELKFISPNPDQPRKTFDEEYIQGLASSIETHGLLHPITVKKKDEGEGYVLVAGGYRFRAHQLLNRETIFAIITKSNNPDEITLIENIQRSDLSPLEESEAFARLMDRHGYTQEELGKVVGKAQNTVSAVLRLNTLPDVIKQEYPTSDRVSKSTLLEVARLDSSDKQLALWEQIRRGNPTVRSTRHAKKSGSMAKKPSRTEQMLSVGRSFIRNLKRVNPQGLADNKDQYMELLKIRDHINDFVNRIPA
jgi:ParB family transcriptional regulator, chromosome partitioning protein